MSIELIFEQTGGPEVLLTRPIKPTTPGPGEAWIDQDAIGVNFLDVTHRTGIVPVPLPSGLGVEGAGRVVATGEGVTNVSVGDRVAYALGPLGGYAAARLIPADRLVRLPETLSFDDAAAIMLKGLTAHYLLKSTFEVKQGTNVLMYGVAGALGQVMAPWAKHLGARLIGVVARREAVSTAREAGCDEVLVWGEDDLPAEVSRMTDGKLADVVYDGVGRDTFDASLDCLRVRGMMVSIGATSGIPEPIDIRRINQKSLYVTRPSLVAYTSDPDEYASRARDVFAAIEAGVIHPAIWRTYALHEAADVHRIMEARQSRGTILLKP